MRPSRFNSPRYTLVIMLLVAVSHAPAAEPTTQKQVDVVFGASFAAWARGSQRDAERLVRQLSTEYPETARSTFFDAMMYSNRYNDEFATSAFKKVVALAPDSTEGRFAAIHIKLERAQDRAPLLAELKQLVSEHSDDPVLMYAMALELYEGRQYEETLAAARVTAAFVQPGPAQLHQTIGNALHMLDRHEEALRHRQLAVELEPAGWSNAALGLTLSKLKRYEEANQAYARAITFHAAAAHFLNWSRNLRDSGKFDAAMEKVDQAIRVEPQSAEAWQSRAYLLQRMGRWDDALVDYEKARKFEPKNGYAYRAGIELLKKLGRDEDAAKILESWKAAGNSGEPQY